jgi:hypothetical protein
MWQTIDDHVLEYEELQFLMDATVMFVIVMLSVSLSLSLSHTPTLTMFFSQLSKYKYDGSEPSRVSNVVNFSVIFLCSLAGAMGLAIRATSGNVFCEEFLSIGSEKCRGAVLVIAMSWTSVIIGELIYLSQSMPCGLIRSFSYPRDLGFMVGQAPRSHGSHQVVCPAAAF